MGAYLLSSASEHGVLPHTHAKVIVSALGYTQLVLPHISPFAVCPINTPSFFRTSLKFNHLTIATIHVCNMHFLRRTRHKNAANKTTLSLPLQEVHPRYVKLYKCAYIGECYIYEFFLCMCICVYQYSYISSYSFLSRSFSS